MKKNIFTVLIFLFTALTAMGQNDTATGKIIVSRLMDSLWIHPSSFINHNDPNWVRLNQHLHNVDILQLNGLIHSIYYGENSFMLNRSEANIGFIGALNRSANEKKQKKFHEKIRAGFRDTVRYPQNKVVLIEGDSWFEYPVFVKDITDHLEKKPNLAVYSLAYGGDWISNMISNLQYEFDYVKIRPDVFIISGGGNDLVGDYRLSSFIRPVPLKKSDPFLNDYRNYVLLRMMKKPVAMCNAEYCNIDYTYYQDSIAAYTKKVDTALIEQIVTGRRYLNKNFYRWVATIKLEYKILFESLRKIDTDQFKSIKIITQGYDYPIPSYKQRFCVGMYMKNGQWLKEPLMVRGINDEYSQRSILKAIIFEINEMLIELGKEYDNIYHVDIRGFTQFYEQLKGRKPGSFWFDELHPKSKVFKIIADVYSDVIDGRTPSNEHVINVIDLYTKKNGIKKEVVSYHSLGK